MIEKIRHKLIIRYTVIAACILLLDFAASYAAYRHNSVRLMQDTLYDYLTEELWEADEIFRTGNTQPEIYKTNSDIKSFYNFAYWLVDKKIIRAEQPGNDEIATRLEQRLLTKNYQAGKIYHENIKHLDQKWYFILIKEDLKLTSGQHGEVFVLANYTPIRKNARAYIKVALIAAGIMIFLAYLTGNFFAARSMKYIEQSYQRQKQFVSDAAHELRTPLTILYSYAELLEYKPKKKIIADIKEEIQLMSEMVDRLLAIARYENSNVVLNKESICLNTLADRAIKSMSALCPSASFKLIDGGQKFVISADKIMIQQLLFIFIDNAVKYTTDDKKISIVLSALPMAVKIQVKDNGIGIKKDDLAHIFDRFWQAEKSRSQKGLGLGLSLAETIVSLHKGSIRVQSEPGQGTTFEIILPQK